MQGHILKSHHGYLTEGHAGLEPAMSAWKAEVLPNYTNDPESDQRDLHPRLHLGKVKCYC